MPGSVTSPRRPQGPAGKAGMINSLGLSFPSWELPRDGLEGYGGFWQLSPACFAQSGLCE